MSLALENLMEQNYPGMNLPPLWQVIYQESMRGNHLLFQKNDVERYDQATSDHEAWLTEDLASNMEVVALKIIACSELAHMVKIIDSLEDKTRFNLYVMYRRVIWMWRNYIKNKMN